MTQPELEKLKSEPLRSDKKEALKYESKGWGVVEEEKQPLKKKTLNVISTDACEIMISEKDKERIDR